MKILEVYHVSRCHRSEECINILKSRVTVRPVSKRDSQPEDSDAVGNPATTLSGLQSVVITKHSSFNAIDLL
jgi:hypothetical protein